MAGEGVVARIACRKGGLRSGKWKGFRGQMVGPEVRGKSCSSERNVRLKPDLLGRDSFAADQVFECLAGADEVWGACDDQDFRS